MVNSVISQAKEFRHPVTNRKFHRDTPLGKNFAKPNRTTPVVRLINRKLTVPSLHKRQAVLMSALRILKITSFARGVIPIDSAAEKS